MAEEWGFFTRKISPLLVSTATYPIGLPRKVTWIGWENISLECNTSSKLFG
ncbi:unnamed protein product [Fusarium graminearum]|uniref:Chromosome 2, complete genome n=1 Tax=Gibberella zeae (strain ATCC MYA-4620 / CBS 123657 / FGSC 9075 / NRRL 31084 / PH-1) TaxID=229533 RepID=A0A098DE78_GIBZE|nr:unnamed protein product [Fusarium graminearum]CZS80041.1 unnamed protein product [Fusarium graminearum]